MKELSKIIQGRSQHHFIEGTGGNLEHGHLNNLADDFRINHNNIPCNRKLSDNPIFIILHHLKMSIKFSDQSGEHNASVVVEVALVIGLDNLMDII
jgi:hypothetical protein